MPDVLSAPRLGLHAGDRRIAENVGWSVSDQGNQVAAAALKVGAFTLEGGSADCALLITLQPGAYTMQIDDTEGETGNVLAEIYLVPVTEL